VDLIHDQLTNRSHENLQLFPEGLGCSYSLALVPLCINFYSFTEHNVICAFFKLKITVVLRVGMLVADRSIVVL
jgi:hypothetical protein